LCIGARLRCLARAYQRASERHPFSVASASAAVILSTADIAAQRTVGIEKWDWKRTLSLGVFGLLYYGFPLKAIYLGYDKVLGQNQHMTKMFIDVYLHTPFLLIPCFYGITGTVKGEGIRSWTSQLREEWLEASFGSILYWTPIQVLCFKSVPQHSRVLYISTASLFHKVWLSWMSNRQRVAAQENEKNVQEKA